MDPTLPNQCSEASDVKQSFRKPINDSSHRRYRRHSPVNDADSSSSDEFSMQRKDREQIPLRDNHEKDYQRKRNSERELDRDHYYRHGRSASRYTSSDRDDRYKYRSSHSHRRRDRRDFDGEDRNNRTSSRSDWEPRDAAQHDQAKQEQSRGPPRYVDRHSRDRYDDGYRSHSTKPISGEHPKDRGIRDDRRETHGTKPISGEHSKDRGIRDDRRETHGSPGKYKNEDRYLCEGIKSHSRDFGSKSTCKSGNKESDGQDNILNKRGHDKEREWDVDKRDKGSVEEIHNKRGSSSQLDKNVRHDMEKKMHTDEDLITSTKKHKLGHVENTFESFGSEKSPSKLKALVEDEMPNASAKHVKEINSKFTSAPSSSVNQSESGVDVSAAKVAALKAAELVNRNIGGVGFLSTDQKKKLLWGNKKNTATEESGSRWEVPLFSDRDRQEKFNKLMGVKGELKLQPKSEDKDGNLQAEKQEQVQMDLEKQYTAGLRRRDGRTVGLGL